MLSPPQSDATPGPPPLAEIERSAARYLLAIAEESAGGTDRVSTGDLRERLDVSAASVTEMVSKLADSGLVDYEKYAGVRLTDRGEAIATRIGWRFCVVSTFFEESLEMGLDDETAFDIGFTLPEDGVFRLRSLVGSACLGRCPESDGDERCVA